MTIRARTTSAPAGSGRVEVRTTDGATYRAWVGDETDVIGRYVAARCGELRLRRLLVAALTVGLVVALGFFEGERLGRALRGVE